MSSNIYPKAFACYNKDESTRYLSTSGGVFTILAEHFLQKKNSVVYGAAFDKNYNVRHIRISKSEEIALLRGSKYPQSVMGNCYQEVLKDLKDNKTVFFTGTPCQIHGLHAFLGKRYDNLWCMDFVCHGVASDSLWRAYVEMLKKRGEIKNIVFKAKPKGWKKWYFKVEYSDGIWQRRGMMTEFMLSYLSYCNVRPSCYECRFKGLSRPSDFTISDCWGIGEQDTEMNDNKGLSALLIQNDRAWAVLEQIKEHMAAKEYDPGKLMEGNWTTFYSVKPSPVRDAFFKEITQNGAQNALKKFFSPKPKDWIKYYLQRIFGSEK